MSATIITGIFTLAGVGIGYLISKWGKKKEKHDQTLFDIYIKLLDIYELYFWLTTSISEDNKSTFRTDIRRLTYSIMKLLRTQDDLDLMNDTVDVLVIEKDYKYADRYKDIGDLINKFGDRLNPTFNEVLSSAGKQNQQWNLNNMGKNPTNTAPCNFK